MKNHLPAWDDQGLAATGKKPVKSGKSCGKPSRKRAVDAKGAKPKSRAPENGENLGGFEVTPELGLGLADFERFKTECTYQECTAAWFCSKSDPHWALSNSAGSMPIYFPLRRSRRNEWCASEQLFHACKYGTDVECLPEANPGADPCVRNRIRNCTNARGSNMTQKCAVIAGLVREDWEDPAREVRIQAMLWVLELKLYWNPFTFGKVLLATGARPIVAVSDKDPFWGCLAMGNGQLRGSNVLGKLMMDVRERMGAIHEGRFSNPEGWLLP
jgi:predicted NAD-dependent protein-ADP-ribosyltransferase YbiA (DUF1768 family)